ncbi:DUF721 domain-containing protein [Patescibacteria group bacterium]|nr:MAG: DUF721 domain-containing protein [Patescibacteria group bacterium]
MGLSSMRDLLSGSAFNRPGVRRSIHAAMVVESANRMIPGYLPGMQAFEIVAISFKSGVLRLRVKSAAARHGLGGMEQELLTKLRQEFPSIPIDRIQTVISKEPSRYEFS